MGGVKIYTCGFMFSPNLNQVLLIKRTKEPVIGMWNGIGGNLEEGEGRYESMVREFREETGLEADHWKQFLMLRGGAWVVHFFKTFTGSMPKIENQPGEDCIRMAPITLLSVQNVVPNLRWIIPLALDPDVVGVVEVEDRG